MTDPMSEKGERNVFRVVVSSAADEGIGPRRSDCPFRADVRGLAASPFERFLGVWTGGGQIVGTNGHRESIRCRAEYAEAKDGAALSQTIVCASESFKFDIQSYAEASRDSVQGYWREDSRDVSGNMTGRISADQFVGESTAATFSASISLTSNGRTQTVSIHPRGGDIFRRPHRAETARLTCKA